MRLEILLWSNTADATACNTFMQNAGWIGTVANAAGSFPLLKNMFVDYVGPLVKTPAVLDINGVITTPAVVYAGYHVNVLFYGADADALTNGLQQVNIIGQPISIQFSTNIMTSIPTLNVPGQAILAVNGPHISLAYMLKDSVTGVYVYDTMAVNMVGGNRHRVWA
jgi:hypothetical protein